MFGNLLSTLRTAISASIVGLSTAMLVISAAKAEEATLQDIAKAMRALPQIVIYPAREIVTLDEAQPTAEAVAVVGDRILATGSLEDLRAAAGEQPFTVNTTFADQVIVPGFIAQHDTGSRASSPSCLCLLRRSPLPSGYGKVWSWSRPITTPAA